MMNLTKSQSNGARGGLVKSNKVQTQFAELSRERDRLQREALGADRARKVQEDSIKAIRQSQASLAEKIRQAHGNLGTETKKRLMLQEEQSSKTALLEKERNEIDQLNRGLSELETKEKASKVSYVKEMSKLNGDLENAIRQQQESSLRRVVSVETAKHLLELVQTVESTLAAEKAIVLSPQEREVVVKGILDGIDLLEEATSKEDQEEKKFAKLEEERRVLRRDAMNGLGTIEEERQPLGETELDELERVWENNWNEEGAAGGANASSDTVNMNLFYGGKDAVPEDEELPVETNEKENAMPSDNANFNLKKAD